MKIRILFFIFYFIIIYFQSNAEGYDDEFTHPELTINSVRKSKLDNYLKNNLAFNDGIATKMPSDADNDILSLIKKGSSDEDQQPCRRGNHMHNPLLPWNVSYDSDQWWSAKGCDYIFGWEKRYSNITWATGYLSPPPDGQKESFTQDLNKTPLNWDKARDYYFKALTSKTNLPPPFPPGRDRYFVDTFLTLGHILHLLQDMSVPAHTRNDFASHLMNGIKQPYEHYVKAKNTTLMASALSEITNYPANYFPAFNNISLTDYWDTEKYNGSNPSTLLDIGLAEFSNANYFSDYTIPANSPTPIHQFPYPYISSSNVSGPSYQECFNEVSPGVIVKYISRNNGNPCPSITDTNAIDHFAVVGLLIDYPVTNSFSYMWLDDNVHKTYANELLPRTIGYSAGLIDYFFRGTLEITSPKEYVYSIIDGSVTPQKFTKIKANVKNMTLNEIMTNGILQAVVKYKVIPNYDPLLANYPPDGTAMKDIPYSYKISLPITLTQEQLGSMNMYPTQFTFDFTNSPIPAGITDLYLQVIFKGTLGNEKDNAVAVGLKDLKEPTHQTFWNLTDRFSLNDHLYTAEQIKADDDLLSSAGSSHIDPYSMNFEISYMADTPPLTSPIKVANVNNLLPGQHIRLIMLVDSDKEDNHVRFTWTDNIVDAQNGSYDLEFGGIINEEINGVWQTPTPAKTFRNVNQHFYSGSLRCKPLTIDPITGQQSCFYPPSEEPPANPTPVLVTIDFQ